MNKWFDVCIILFAITLVTECDNRANNDLLDDKTIVPIIQLLLQLSEEQNKVHQYYSPKNNYVMLSGKGNTRPKHHHLSRNTSELNEINREPTDEVTTLDPIHDLATNRHLLKFLARNGAAVWKRLQAIPQHDITADKDIVNAITEETAIFEKSESALIEDIVTTTTFATKYLMPRPNTSSIRNRYKHKSTKHKSAKKMAKKSTERPDLQTDNGYIERNGKHSRKVKNKNRKSRNKALEANRDDIDYKPKSRKSLSAKPKYKIIESEAKQKPIDNNRVGNIIIKGFNGLFNGIGSLFG